MRHSNVSPTTTGKSASILQPPVERSSVRPWPSRCSPEKVLLNCDVKRGCWRCSIRGSSLIVRGGGCLTIECRRFFMKAIPDSSRSNKDPRAPMQRCRGFFETASHRLLLHIQQDVPTTVLLIAGFRGVRAERARFAIRHDRQLLGTHTRLDEIAPCSLRSLFPQDEVIVSRAPFAGMTLNLHQRTRMILQPLCVVV